MLQLTLDLATSFVQKNIISPFLSIRWSKLFKTMNPILLVNQENMILDLWQSACKRSIFTSRKIERLAEENLYTHWLMKELAHSYQTITHFLYPTDMPELIRISTKIQ